MRKGTIQDPPWEEWTLLLNNNEIKRWSKMFAPVQWPLLLFLEQDHKNPKYGQCRHRPVSWCGAGLPPFLLGFFSGLVGALRGQSHTELCWNRDWPHSLPKVWHCQCVTGTSSEPWSGCKGCFTRLQDRKVWANRPFRRIPPGRITQLPEDAAHQGNKPP